MNIKFDYSLDRSRFTDDPGVRAALDRAAQIWSGYLLDDFQTVPAGTQFGVTDPSDSSAMVQITLDAPIDDLLIFVGADDLGGWRNEGGTLVITGGTAGATGYDATGDFFQSRVYDTFRGNPITDFEPWVGSLSFNSNSDAVYSTDLDGPVTNQIDLLSVALHEIGHILGFGGSGPYDQYVVGTTFTGPNSIAVNGGAPVPLEPDGHHILDGFASDTTLFDPNSFIGTRILPTAYDLAILADIGYEIDGFTKIGTVPALTTTGDDNPVFGTILADTIDGLAGDDQLQGNRGGDTLLGGPGNDTLFGQEDDDFLFGGADDDFLYGNDGADTLQGDQGTDILFGGPDSDTFVFSGETGQDRIGDFDYGAETIRIEGDHGFSSVQDVLDAQTRPFSNVTRLTFSDGNWVEIFDNETGSTLTAANIDLVGTTNSAPTVSGPAALSADRDQAISLGALISVSDADGLGDLDYVRFWDNTPGTDDGTIRYNGNAISGGFVDVSYGQLGLVSYLAGPSNGTNDIVVEAFDDAGADSNDLEIRITVGSGSSGSAPVLALVPAFVDLLTSDAEDEFDRVSGDELVDVSDPDGDLWFIRFSDATLGTDGGTLALDGVPSTTGIVEVGPAGLDRVSYLAGPDAGTNEIAIQAFDTAGNASAPATVRMNVLAPTNSTRPVIDVTGVDEPATIGTFITLSDLFTVSDPDGIDYVEIEMISGEARIGFIGSGSEQDYFRRDVEDLDNLEIRVRDVDTSVQFSVTARDTVGDETTTYVGVRLEQAPSHLVLEHFARIGAYAGPNDPLEIYVAANETYLLEGWEVDRVFEFNDTDFSAKVFKRDGYATILAIRGTAGGTDWVENGAEEGVGAAELETAWDNALFRQWVLDQPGLIITGHSQGGAQAQQLALLINQAGGNLRELVTFNSAGVNDDVTDLPSALDFDDVTHYISAGDVVSQVGWNFIPGRVGHYDLPHEGLIHTLFLSAHTGHWAQAELYDLSREIGLTPGERADHEISFSRLPIEDLVSADFSHLDELPGVDDDYQDWVGAMARLVSSAVALPASLLAGPTAGLIARIGSGLAVREILGDRDGTESARANLLGPLLELGESGFGIIKDDLVGPDIVYGDFGDDVFIFGDRYNNGEVEVITVHDYTAGEDKIYLEPGVAIVGYQEDYGLVQLYFDAEGDVGIIRGEDISYADLSIFNSDGLEI